MRDVAQALPATEVPLDGIGALCRKQEIKALYAACADPDNVLADACYDSADALGLADHFDDHPHVSLVRPDRH